MDSEVMRSVLFVPGSRPERFDKALAAGADAVIIDLEDAVEAHNKEQARNHIRTAARHWPAGHVLVRINDATTPWFEDDLALCADLPAVAAVVLPKAESRAQLEQVAATGRPAIPIVESARGVLGLDELAAGPGVLRLSFGSLDLMLETGTTPDTAAAHTLLEHVRCRILLHSAAHGLAQPLDGVYPDFTDASGLQTHARHVRDMGFGGMLCIHPRQIAPIHDGFAPSPQEQAWARQVVEHAERTGSSAFQLEGKMVDVPVIERARRILRMA